MPDDMPNDEPMTPMEPAMRDALAARFGEVPATDWSALESRITAGAQFRLAQRRPSRTWRSPAARWARVLIPAGLAASLLLAVSLAFGPSGSAGAETDDGMMADVVAVAASSALPSDPLSLTDQQAFLSTMLSQESAP